MVISEKKKANSPAKYYSVLPKTPLSVVMIME